MPVLIAETDLSSLAAKVVAGERLTPEDGLRLSGCRDIHEIGRLADLVRRRLHGDAAYYNVNRHINYTNSCVLRCKFCSFYRSFPVTRSGRRGSGRGVPGKRSGAPVGRALPTAAPPSPAPAPHPSDAYELSVDDIVRLAQEAYNAGATEVHIVGGLHPKLPFAYYLDMLCAIRAACPRICIKAFTAVEIIHFTRIARPRLGVPEVLEQLRAAGLDCLPGGGAEIFDDRVHNEAYRAKVGEQGWFDVHRVAHELGISTNATMLYGHLETPAERITHLVKLREHQDESLRSRRAAFNCFVPLPFIPEGSELAHLPGPTGLDDLRTLAISRLMLDNIPHLKAFWIMQSPKLAQVPLSWGVDDLDGTVVQYDITKREGRTGSRHQELTIEQLCRLVQEAGFTPVERDSFYRPIRREGATWEVADPA